MILVNSIVFAIEVLSVNKRLYFFEALVKGRIVIVHLFLLTGDWGLGCGLLVLVC